MFFDCGKYLLTNNFKLSLASVNDQVSSALMSWLTCHYKNSIFSSLLLLALSFSSRL